MGCECAVGAPGCGWELYWVLHECLVAVREVGRGGGGGWVSSRPTRPIT